MAEVPEEPAVAVPLALAETFAPVPTAAWEQQARLELDGGADALLWRTAEGVVVKAFYRSEDIAGLTVAMEAVPGRAPRQHARAGGWQAVEAPAWSADAIRADRLHDAGATAVQELAWAIAEAADRLASVSDGSSLSVAVARLEFVFAVGSTYFIEIAKLRAARLLWAAVTGAFGQGGHPMRLHARTARANTSVLAPHTNLLRGTTEAMSAVIGGADTVWVEPDGYEPHLAVNVQHLLAEEAHLDAVGDPAAGSYYIEALTDALAREAWGQFQQIETAGGYAARVAAGDRDRQVQASAQARTLAVALRRRTLVGVNDYPDFDPQPPPADPAPFEPGDGSLPPLRLAAPFESIRRRTARHAAASGHLPVVHLITRGDVRTSLARAHFCRNLFGCAGFAVTQGDTLPDAADLLVLCSGDDDYPAFARDVLPRVAVPVVVAGHPPALVELLRSTGIQGFVYAGIDAVQTLTYWQDRLGMVG